MNEIIFDGRVHILDTLKACCILKKEPQDLSDRKKIKDIIDELLMSVLEYVHTVRAGDIRDIVNNFQKNSCLLAMEIILRPTYQADYLSRYGTVAIKFNRLQGDGKYFMNIDLKNKEIEL